MAQWSVGGRARVGELCTAPTRAQPSLGFQQLESLARWKQSRKFIHECPDGVIRHVNNLRPLASDRS